ncbi:alpha/beta hydrolase [Alkalihalobacillus sp. 1P02AB]|uniref:alpha/beta hydrolase n=1 Tax=Alkalihalobacillus sp. 1P02AB TaxID=3132260 RepID=UPI0039A46D68
MVNQLNGDLSEAIINSQFLNEEQKLMIYTPPNFTPMKSYHLLICQDGQDYFQLGRIPRQVDTLIEEVELREVIIIGVPYPSVKERRKRYHPDEEKFASYLRFLVDELMPFLEDKFPLHSLASSRTLAGDSLAGTVSLMAALKYPATFGQVMMHSPLVNETVLQAVSDANTIDGLAIYHMIGQKETAVKTTNGQVLDFLEPNRQLKEALEKLKIDYTYGEFDGDHTWTYWQKDLENGLKKLLPFE